MAETFVVIGIIGFWYVVGYVAGTMALLWLSGFEASWIGALFAIVAIYQFSKGDYG